MARKNVLRKILIATVVSNVLLFSALVGLLIYNQKYRETKTQMAKTKYLSELLDDAGVCVTCNYLGSNITAQNTLFSSISMVNKDKICCINEPDFLPKLIRQMILPEKQRKLELTPSGGINKHLRWWRSRANSIHMNLDFENRENNKLAWTDNDTLGVAFSNGLILNRGTNSIIIPGSSRARYFVYVAIAYDFKDIDIVPVFYHNVTKSHPLLPLTVETLLMSKYGGSSQSDRQYTSFLCGTFEIQGDFNIKTEVSNIEYVSRSKYASFFGMFQL